ncbi:MBL fold metallo-hydrolase, partial [Clostridioides difficile]
MDTVIISHGHFDHGGALKKFLDINSVANIYVQKE